MYLCDACLRDGVEPDRMFADFASRSVCQPIVHRADGDAESAGRAGEHAGADERDNNAEPNPAGKHATLESGSDGDPCSIRVKAPNISALFFIRCAFAENLV